MLCATRLTFPSDDDGAGHLVGDDLASQDAATDGNETSEGALLVDVGAIDGLLRGLQKRRRTSGQRVKFDAISSCFVDAP